MRRFASRLTLWALCCVPCLLVTLSCASAQPSPGTKQAKAPDWLFNLQSSYPSDRYLAAVGTGDTRRSAEEDAAGALARIFSVRIAADSVAEQRYREISSSTTSSNSKEESVSQKVSMSTDETLVNLSYSEPYVDGSGRVSIVAFIDREATARLYRASINRDRSLVESFKGRADSASTSLLRYACLDAALQVEAHGERSLARLAIIHPASASALSSAFDAAALLVARDAAAEKLGYRLSISGDDEGKIGESLKTALAGQKLLNRADGSLEVRGRWSAEAVSVNPQFKSIQWTVQLSLLDETGAVVASYHKESRSNAISESEARAFAYKDAEKALQSGFLKSLTDYLDHLVGVEKVSS
jgi:hypothetical protein